MRKRLTPTSKHYYPKRIRAPESPADANTFIAGFYAMNLAFNLDITAKDGDMIAPLLAPSLREHVEAKGLQIRAIEGQEPHAINTAVSMDGWQFLYTKSVGRANEYGGPEWHAMTRPNIYECKISNIVKAAEKIPQFNPPLSGKLLVMICKFISTWPGTLNIDLHFYISTHSSHPCWTPAFTL